MNRFHQDDLQTLATLQCADRTLFVIERPWKQNRNFISRIPPGDFLMRVKGPNEGRRGVRIERIGGDLERTVINLEIANLASQLEGCGGMGTGVKMDGNSTEVFATTNSGLALGILIREMAKWTKLEAACVLEIRDRF